MQFIDWDKVRESLEKWPPDWANYEWNDYDQDDFDNDVRNRCRNRSSVGTSFRKR